MNLTTLFDDNSLPKNYLFLLLVQTRAMELCCVQQMHAWRRPQKDRRRSTTNQVILSSFSELRQVKILFRGPTTQ
jgi:hypothetical protein